MLARDEEMRKEYLRHKDLAAEDMRQTLLPELQALVLIHYPTKCQVRFDGPYIVLRKMGTHNMAMS